MAETSDSLQQVKAKKITGKDIAKMSTEEFIRAGQGLYWRLLTYLKPHKGRFALSVMFGVLSGIFNGVMILAIRVVFTVVLPSERAKGPTPIKPFKKMPFWQDWEVPRPQIAEEHEWIFVAIVCLSIPVLMLIRGMLAYLHTYFLIWVGHRVVYRLRDECFSGLLGQSLSFFNKAKQAELMQTVYIQTRMATMGGTELASAFIKYPISIFSILFVLVWIEPIYTIGALVVFPLCILPVMQVSRRVRKAGAKEEEEAGAMMVTMQESFSGIRVVKSYAREQYERDRFNAGSRNLLKSIMRWQKAMEIVGPMVETVASFGMAIGLIYAWHQKIDAGTFLILNMALMSMYPHVKGLSRVQVQLQKCLMATSKVFAFIDAEPDVADVPDAKELTDAKGAISFKRVTFAYTKGIKALRRMTIDFEAGKNYALVGQSGAGKSTVMSLIMRFYDPIQGRILIDGRDIQEYTQVSLRDQIGLVSQDTFLFHDTIYNNIRYGNLEATEEQVVEAAKLAHAHEFIIEQADGYETELGDQGCTLSGGQQQRVSIARAILRNAPILLLDEAYSSLDSESEKKIHEALEALASGKTVIAIAHRLSTILNADQIVAMKDGEILDVGTHPELLGRCEEYQRLYNLQFHSYESELDVAAEAEVEATTTN